MAEVLDVLKGPFSKKEESTGEIDDILEEELIKRVVERYKEEGEYIPTEEETVPESLQEIITMRTITSKTTAPIENHPSSTVRSVGSIYKRMKGIVDKVMNRFVNNKILRQVDFDLYSANIKLTAAQYLALVTTISLLIFLISLPFAPLAGIVTFFLTHDLTLTTKVIIYSPLIALLISIMVFLLGLYYPKRVAISRGSKMEKELPFALRHLAVVIRSGMSLYKAMESIATADYGVLSEEFRRTLKEISEGKTTEEALESFSLRSRSRSMRRVISQIIRALRIGGNLSDAMKRIAEDVSFEQRAKVIEFSEKLNLVGVVFMFVGIVFPALLAILSGIGNAPMGENMLQAFALSPKDMITLYLVVIPLFMVFILLFVKMSDPLGE